MSDVNKTQLRVKKTESVKRINRNEISIINWLKPCYENHIYYNIRKLKLWFNFLHDAALVLTQNFWEREGEREECCIEKQQQMVLMLLFEKFRQLPLKIYCFEIEA